MELAIIGLRKMGAFMTERLTRVFVPRTQSRLQISCWRSCAMNSVATP